MGADDTHLANPNSVSVDGNGNVFVADSENQRVQIFDPSGNFLATVAGTWGNEPGQFNFLNSVSLDSDGDLYMADKYNHRVQRFLDPTKEIYLPLVRK
jgi:sugar lactone lactonase YvrE